MEIWFFPSISPPLSILRIPLSTTSKCKPWRHHRPRPSRSSHLMRGLHIADPLDWRRTPVAEYIAKEGVHPPLVLPPTPEIAPLQEPSAAQRAQEKRTAAAGRFISDPPKQYHSVIPQFFQDTDAPENSEQFNRAISLTDSLPVPPSLPMFLNRSILNNSTPMKDDASVLVLPNHTVLNHLATSSIRNHVIATSATTRYRKKVFCAELKHKAS